MEPYLHLDGIRGYDNEEETLEHLKMVLGQLDGMLTNLGFALTFLNNKHNNLIDEFEEKYDVSFAKGHNELDNFLQAVYKEIENNKMKIKSGQKVTYVTDYRKEQGIVKSISNDDYVFVVYHCNEDWDNYSNYTAERTRIKDLKLGWEENTNE